MQFHAREIIQRTSILFFILSVFFLFIVAILAIWDVFPQEYFFRSVATLFVLTATAFFVYGSAYFLTSHKDDGTCDCGHDH